MSRNHQSQSHQTHNDFKHGAARKCYIANNKDFLHFNLIIRNDRRGSKFSKVCKENLQKFLKN
jgi:hypothetical protein